MSQTQYYLLAWTFPSPRELQGRKESPLLAKCISFAHFQGIGWEWIHIKLSRSFLSANLPFKRVVKSIYLVVQEAQGVMMVAGC